MAEDDPVLWVRPEDRTPGPVTPGMDRQQAVTSERMWSGLARTDPGMVTAWHHHGEYETVIYVVSGAFTIEFGAGGRQRIEAGPGDFLFVPPGAVHRERNPLDVPSEVVVVRSGAGESTFNLDGPAPA